MSTPFLGQICMFGGTFAPRSWAFCDGQLLAVYQNSALFSLLGTVYGGDGRTNFGLPDMRGRLPLHQGSGPGLSPRAIGSKTGTEDVTLIEAHLPIHTHSLDGTTEQADAQTPDALSGGDPTDKVLADASFSIYRAGTPDSDFDVTAVTETGGLAAGGTHSHDNIMPFLCVNFIIALLGVFPSRN